MGKSLMAGIQESTGVNALLEGGSQKPVKRTVGRPANPHKKKPVRSAQEGAPEGFCRCTFLVNEEQLEKIKAIAYWDRDSIKDVVFNAFEEKIKKFERKDKRGDEGAVGEPVKPKPAKRKH